MFVVTGMELEKEAFRAFQISQVSYLKQRVCQRRNPFLICPLLFLTQVGIFFYVSFVVIVTVHFFQLLKQYVFQGSQDVHAEINCCHQCGSMVK